MDNPSPLRLPISETLPFIWLKERKKGKKYKRTHIVCLFVNTFYLTANNNSSKNEKKKQREPTSKSSIFEAKI